MRRRNLALAGRPVNTVNNSTYWMAIDGGHHSVEHPPHYLYTNSSDAEHEPSSRLQQCCSLVQYTHYIMIMLAIDIIKGIPAYLAKPPGPFGAALPCPQPQ